MERWWDVTERGKAKQCEKKKKKRKKKKKKKKKKKEEKKKKKKKKKNLSPWHFVYHIFHMVWSEIEPKFA